jgi:hypothetical protein
MLGAAGGLAGGAGWPGGAGGGQHGQGDDRQQPGERRRAVVAFGDLLLGQADVLRGVGVLGEGGQDGPEFGQGAFVIGPVVVGQRGVVWMVTRPVAGWMPWSASTLRMIPTGRTNM